MKKKVSSVNTIITIIGLMLIARVIGLVRETFTAYTFGSTMKTDAYVVGLLLTINLFLGVGSALTTTLVPKVVKAKSEAEGYKTINQLLTWLLTMIAIISVVYYITAPVVVSFASNFRQIENAQMTTVFVRILIPGIVFICLTYFMQGILHANQKFVMPALTSFPANILFFIYIFTVVDHFGLYGLAVIMVSGWMLQFLFLLIPVIKDDMLSFHIDFGLSPEVKQFFLALLPITLVTLMHTFNLMYDNNRASAMGDGYLTAIYYGNTLFRAIVQTTVYGITAVMFPKFNEKFVEKNYDGLMQSIVNVLRSICLLLIPMSVGMMILGDDVIKLIFERGLFDAQGSMTTVIVFVRYASFMVAFGIIDVLNKAYFTVGDTKKPMIITGVVIVANIIASNLLIPIMGFSGIVVGTSVAYYVGAILSLIIFFKEGGLAGIKRTFKTFMKSLVAGSIMGILVYIFKSMTITEASSDALRIGVVALSALVGAVVYGLGLLLMREELITHNVKTWLIKKGFVGNR